MNPSAFRRGLLALLASMAFSPWAAGATDPEFRTGVFSPPRQAPDFTLRGSDGSSLALSKYRGKVVALGFGYTSCPDVCPTTLAYLAQARKKLGAAGKDLQVVYVTVDPERDTPERLRKFIANFDASFLGATGTPQQLADVRKGYGITITRKNIEGTKDYLVHHSSYIYLIDRAGNLRAMMPFGVSVDDMAHDLKTLLDK